MDTIKCPKCRFNAAAFEKIDDNGAHYTCPNCDHKWNDPSIKLTDLKGKTYTEPVVMSSNPAQRHNSN